jgi:hypothetical protein
MIIFLMMRIKRLTRLEFVVIVIVVVDVDVDVDVDADVDVQPKIKSPQFSTFESERLSSLILLIKGGVHH